MTQPADRSVLKHPLNRRWDKRVETSRVILPGGHNSLGELGIYVQPGPFGDRQRHENFTLVGGAESPTRPRARFLSDPVVMLGAMNGLDLLLPVRCAGCGVRGTDCCVACLDGFGPPERIHVPGVGPPVWTLAAYDGAARELVLGFKERGARALSAWFGAMVAAALVVVGPRPWTLIPAPSRESAARERGGDHMRRVAEAVYEAAVAPVLGFRAGVADSVGLGAGARRRNLAGRVEVHGRPPVGTTVLLDDIVTTGATAAACVRALRGAGVRTHAVLALTSARTGTGQV